ncbi:[acyl-carrier-protein] S-malonyltransferase [Natronocella acetinitrilica]|uniref:Malonyl CoA-acyl carrier protein transacylase n=1 Tax=Natronocella acetinitrilica TaxID=414046 RepID=A0AAE3G6G8_9GAMM|nr:ACP S-malonyltransferase [Natronocella acetinitrilica]MCP1676292.1 [acyl-carrier-protein] S-malonyltransferase [Natronocella acetinitrilica]
MNSKLAIVFPGQGSQSVGMLAALAAEYAVVRDTFAEASDALGEDLWTLTQEGPEDRLNQTDITQPAMLAAGVAVWRVWRAQGGSEPAMLAGHSLGEYTALTCAGALDFSEAICVVADRGRFMQQAVPAGEGAMAAVLGLDDDAVRKVCVEAAQGDVVEAVNFNAPGQVVIAGSRSAVERAIEAATAAGAKRATALPVSVPSHCSLMRPASDALAERLKSVAIATPQLPVLHNVDVSIASSPDAIRERLVAQLHKPVMWVDTVRRIGSDGVETLIECGPGKVLAGLTRRIERGLQGVCVQDPDSLNKALAG